MTLDPNSAHECDKCTFVASTEDIVIPKEASSRINHAPFLVGIFSMPGWSGHSPFYVFTCYCNFDSVDYPHGYTNYGLLYLKCQNPECQKKLELCPNKNRAVYELVGGEIPPASKRKRLKNLERTMSEAGFCPSGSGGVFVKNPINRTDEKGFFGSFRDFMRRLRELNLR